MHIITNLKSVGITYFESAAVEQRIALYLLFRSMGFFKMIYNTRNINILFGKHVDSVILFKFYVTYNQRIFLSFTSKPILFCM